MSFDLNILVLNQKRPVTLNYASPIKLRNEIDHEQFGRYCGKWPFVTSQNGIWYNMVAKDGDILNAYRICRTEKRNEGYVPYWVDDDTNNCLTPLIINDDYKEGFVRIMKTLVDGSPDKTVLFLAKYQSTDAEIVSGVLGLEQMFSMLESRCILFNICYIVRSST